MNPQRSAAGARVRPIWSALVEVMPELASGERVVEVLDCGGGSGTFAVPAAAAGARVTVVDSSADALATLSHRADEAGVRDRVNAVHGDVEALAQAVGSATFDVVVAHGLIDSNAAVAPEFVPEMIAALVAATRPGGIVSLTVANPAAAVLAHALAGEPEASLAILTRTRDSEATPAAVQDACTAAGLSIVLVQGVGLFGDLVPGAAQEAASAESAVADLDRLAARVAPYRDLARRVHIVARTPGTPS